MTKFDKLVNYLKCEPELQVRVMGWVARQASAELQYDFSRLGNKLPDESIVQLMNFVSLLTGLNDE